MLAVRSFARNPARGVRSTLNVTGLRIGGHQHQAGRALNVLIRRSRGDVHADPAHSRSRVVPLILGKAAGFTALRMSEGFFNS